MTISIKHEMFVFWAFVLCGQLLGVFYDFFRALRKNVRHKKMSVAIEDAVFCLVSFKMFFDVCYTTNNGGLRWYIFASLICSTVLYFCLASKFVCKFWCFLFKIVSKLLIPFRVTAFFLKRFLGSVFARLKTCITKFFKGNFEKFFKQRDKTRLKPAKPKGFAQFFYKKPFTFLKK